MVKRSILLILGFCVLGGAALLAGLSWPDGQSTSGVAGAIEAGPAISDTRAATQSAPRAATVGGTEPGRLVAQASPPLPRALPESRSELQLSFAPVVRAVAPSVVNVYATRVAEQRSSPFLDDPFFRRFFGDGNPFMNRRPRTSQALGSGVIVDSSGVALTNHHVVQGATDIRIATADGREFAVDLVLDDPETDLAVLKVRDPAEASFPALEFADSDALAVGDLVLAIGNPFGVGQTVTSGIVSALARSGVESSNYEFFIQTDAAINPGNSGGALVDLQGRLVGINTAILSRSGGSIGIGFAIPANMARLVAETGIAGGALVRPWFGARMQAVTSDLAASLGLERARGAMITDIAPEGPAARAGFATGDVILTVDGFEVAQPSAFDFRLATRRVGETAVVTYFRNGQEAELALELEAPPSAGEAVVITGDTRFAGATAETINAAVAQELGLPYSFRGVLIRSVERDSPADDLGLRAGDLVLSLNGREMTDAETFRTASAGRPREGWSIVLQRGSRVIRSTVPG